MVQFIAGVLLGSVIGVLLIAMFVAGRDSDDLYMKYKEDKRDDK